MKCSDNDLDDHGPILVFKTVEELPIRVGQSEKIQAWNQ